MLEALLFGFSDQFVEDGDFSGPLGVGLLLAPRKLAHHSVFLQISRAMGTATHPRRQPRIYLQATTTNQPTQHDSFHAYRTERIHCINSTSTNDQGKQHNF